MSMIKTSLNLCLAAGRLRFGLCKPHYNVRSATKEEDEAYKVQRMCSSDTTICTFDVCFFSTVSYDVCVDRGQTYAALPWASGSCNAMFELLNNFIYV
ncbi:hypothetical protein M758_10G154900 [Ceratodon purpureus]|nr:hypothetical protein M758_10G154900 [Ceratodon purpureus]